MAARTGAREVADLPDAASGIGPAIRKLRLALGETPGKIAQRAAADKEGFIDALDELTAALDRLAAELGLFAERSEDIANCAQRAAEAAAQLARWRAGLATGAATRRRCGRGRARGRVDTLGRRDASGLAAQASPLSVADVFGKRVAESGRAWIFTSATLAVGKDFSLYQRELGLADAATGCWESPFDYASQALLYVPRDLPQPNSREHTEAVVAAALPVLARERRPRVPAVHDAARAQRRARIARRRRSPAKDSTGRCSSRAKARAASSWRASASSATRSCWAARASGRASTCRAPRCRS